MTKNLIEYINKNSIDYDEYKRNRGSDDSTDSEDKFDHLPKCYFRLSDSIKIVSFLRYSLCEQSLYSPFGKYMDSFWLTFGLVALEENCGTKKYKSVRALIDHSKSKEDFQHRLVHHFLSTYWEC